MTKAVVDALELIEVEIEDRKTLSVHQRLKRLLEPDAKQLTIGEAGQRVVVGQPYDAINRVPALGHVFDHTDQVFRFRVIPEDRQPIRRQYSCAVAVRFEHMLVEEQLCAGRYQLIVMAGDQFSLLLGIDVKCGFADRALAAKAEQLFGGAIDEDVSSLSCLL